MYIPSLNTLTYARLYYGSNPIKTRLIKVDETSPDLITVEIHWTKETEIREFNLKEDEFIFFKESIQSPYYYQIIGEHDNSSDGLYKEEFNTYLNLEDVFDEKVNIEKKSNCYNVDVVVKKLTS